MATKKRRPARKKKKASIFNFKLNWPGIVGITVVVFCLFLWMFLIGIWAGQTILLPPGSKQVATIHDETKIRVNKKRQDVRQAKKRTEPLEQTAAVPEKQSELNITAEHIKSKKNTKSTQRIAKDSKQYYTLQIGAYRDVSLARKEVNYWREQKADVYLIPGLDGKDALVRVCVGKFSSQKEAQVYAKKKIKQGKEQPYVTHFPASRFR